MKQASIFAHLRDILILPFTVTCIVPYSIYDQNPGFIPENLFIKILGAAIGLGGAALFLYTVFLFKTIGKGTLAPWSDKQKLVIEGPYKYCRNPMISGVLFILVGEALFFPSIAILSWAGLFFMINNIYFLVSEEPGLYERFGEEYRRYKHYVPRWIPRLKAYHPE